MHRDRRNHLEHDDGLYFTPLPEPNVTRLMLPKTVRILDCSGTDESFAEVCEILAAERLKGVSDRSKPSLNAVRVKGAV